ncbi:MAG: hypothetical protein ABMA64_16590, partial [Myxococcota bacterium]
PGFTHGADGHCYPPPPDPVPPTLTEVLTDPASCDPAKPGADVDWIGGCLDGACAGDTFDAIDAALGRGADCRLNSTATLWTCDWGPVEAAFDVQEGDGTLPAPDAPTDFVRALRGYEGTSPEGLGIGLSPACFVDSLGAPTTALLVDGGGGLALQQATWDLFGLEIEDEERETDLEPIPDGIVDELTLFGAP